MNLGPLLYHFADQPGEASIEPSFEEVKAIAEGLGFELSVSRLSSLATHFQHKYSHDYRHTIRIFFTAVVQLPVIFSSHSVLLSF